jgi:urease accessory protein
MLNRFLAVLILLAVASGPALAHGDVRTHTHGLTAGALHPLTGVDHLLAMLAVGLVAAKLGGRALFALPGAFLAGMFGGGVIALAGVEVPLAEAGILFGLAALAATLLFVRHAPLGVGMAVAGLFGMFHGAAHGSELPELAEPAGYVAGFLVSTAALLLTGAIIGLAMPGFSRAGESKPVIS